MSLSKGQQLALDQLQEIEVAAEGALEIINVRESDKQSGRLGIEVSIYCGGMPKVAGGLPLRVRERVILWVPERFPMDPPTVDSAHTRFENFPHVQWRRRLCLYLSTETEWNPAYGMFGAMTRLNDWLRSGAKDELDPPGGPIHPPAVYLGAGRTYHVIVCKDTPVIEDIPWFGFAALRRKSDNRIDIIDWIPLGDLKAGEEHAVAVLLPKPMPFEYPTSVCELINELTRLDVNKNMLLALLKVGAAATKDDQALFVVIGAPMRGIAGAERLEQHLSVWRLDSVITKGLRLTMTPFEEINEEAEAIILDWANKAKMSWCRIHERRPSVTNRRDHDSPVAWFKDKIVSLWGCGALGSYVGEFLARASVRKVILHDYADVTPGILTRQLFDDHDVGRPKAEALAERLSRIDGELEVIPTPRNVIHNLLEQGPWTDEADVVIDATAARRVALKLEMVWGTSGVKHVPVISLMVGHRADRGIVTVTGSGFSGGPLDVARRAKLEVCTDPRCLVFRDEFWPTPGSRPLFQPEPGCSSPTFVGSAADLAALSGTMLNLAAKQLAMMGADVASADFVECPKPVEGIGKTANAHFSWRPDLVGIELRYGYEVRIAPSAAREMQAWIDRSKRICGAKVETGGLLFGEINELLEIVWISEVSGPPPDSQASPNGFVCGTEGTQEDNVERKTRTLGSVRFMGMWHTHPASAPLPSTTDLTAMYEILKGSEKTPRQTLMLIVGVLGTTPKWGAFLFKRHEFSDAYLATQIRRSK